MPPPSPVALVGADDLVARLAGAIEAVAVDRDLLRGLDPGAEHADVEFADRLAEDLERITQVWSVLEHADRAVRRHRGPRPGGGKAGKAKAAAVPAGAKTHDDVARVGKKLFAACGTGPDATGSGRTGKAIVKVVGHPVVPGWTRGAWFHGGGIEPLPSALAPLLVLVLIRACEIYLGGHQAAGVGVLDLAQPSSDPPADHRERPISHLDSHLCTGLALFL